MGKYAVKNITSKSTEIPAVHLFGILIAIVLTLVYAYQQMSAAKSRTEEQLAVVWPSYSALNQRDRDLIDFSARECRLHAQPADRASVQACLRDGAYKVDEIDPSMDARARISKLLPNWPRKTIMRQTWEQWRSAVLVVLVNSDMAPEEALDLVNEEDSWMRQAFADGEYAGSIALDLLALVWKGKMTMTYSLSRAELASIKDVEMAFSTERLLPKWADIPDEFKRENTYTRLVDALFYGSKLPDFEMQFRLGFDDEAASADLNKCVRAHLQSFAPKHEHKIAGIAFMIAQACELTETQSAWQLRKNMGIEKLIHDIRFTVEAARRQQLSAPLADAEAALVIDEMHGLVSVKLEVDERMSRVRYITVVRA
jgi:hypothetical protein